MADSKYVTGVDATVQSLRVRFDSNVKRAITIAVKAHAQEVYELSQELVPVDKGPLKASGRIELSRDENGLMVAKVVYGGETAPYALWVHENLEAYHAPPTQAKYLERAVAAARPNRKEILKRAFQSVMGFSKVPRA